MNKAATEIWTAHSNEAWDDVIKYIPRLLASGCQHPRKLSVRDRFYGTSNAMYVPCGKCNQCRNTKGNMLASRLYLDGLALKHIYFVTLHFKAYDRPEDIPQALSGMCWHYDNLCSTGRLAYHPCFLDYGVFQHFFAHLRMNVSRGPKVPRGTKREKVNHTLKYFIGCEYGSKFGRPHAHCIIITDFDLTRDDVQRCWKYGSFDFEDLAKNGTMENIGNLSSKKCFKYVAKYANKQDDSFCKTRYNLGVRYLMERYVSGNENSEQTKNILSEYVYSPSRYISQAHQSYYTALYASRTAEPFSTQVYALRNLIYNACKFGHDVSRYYGVKDLGLQDVNFDLWTPDLVRMVFGQRTRISSGNSIGKTWFEANRFDYVQGLRKLPNTPAPKSPQSVGRNARLHGYQDVSTDTGWKLSWPSQFNTWLQRIQEPYCVMEKNLGGQRSCKKISNFLVQALLELSTDLHTSFVARDGFVRATEEYCQSSGNNYIPLACVVRGLPYGDWLGSISDFRVDRELSQSLLYDYRTGELLDGFIECNDLGQPIDVIFQRYKYDRRTRDYIPTDFTSLDMLLLEIRNGFLKSKEDHDKTSGDRFAKLLAYDLCFEEPKVMVDADGNEYCYPAPVDFRDDAVRANEYNDMCWALFRGQKSQEQFLKEVDGLESGLDLPVYNTLVYDTTENQTN